jgi:hypothetical protein
MARLVFKNLDAHGPELFGLKQGQIEVYNEAGTLCFRRGMFGQNLTDAQVREQVKAWFNDIVDKATVAGAAEDPTPQLSNIEALVKTYKWDGSYYPSEEVFDALKSQVETADYPSLREVIGRVAREYDLSLEQR